MERRRIEKGAVDDLVLLDTIDEAAVCANLAATFKQDRIYTYIGPVLLSCNPFKTINGLYSPALLRKYAHRHSFELAPHLFAVAERAYREMLSKKTKQTILIAGESGAGKTEAAKRVMEYISAVSGTATSASSIKDRLLQSNPVLEAFGNAKTIRNDNSSRFGKYLEIYFSFGGAPVGGAVTNYLLEKPRVTGPGPNERSYHIFYMLLAGADSKDRGALMGTSPNDFKNLSRTNCVKVAGLNDRDEFGVVRSAMKSLGLSVERSTAVLNLVGGVLMLGELDFKMSGDAPSCTSKSQLSAAASLLGVGAKDLEGALTHSTIVVRGQQIRSPLRSVEECKHLTAAFAKGTYARMFDCLVRDINSGIHVMSNNNEYNNDSSRLTLGILDIYGFEIFEQNSFEQLCINYCNEKLQQFFIELTLKTEQEEYAREGVPWEEVDYFNNKVVCDLIEGKRPPGLLAFLDEETVLPNATPASLLSKLERNFSKHPHYSKKSKNEFAIQHYAGEVVYICDELIEKNKDPISRDVVAVCTASSQPYVVELFAADAEKASKATVGKMAKTAGAQFRESMLKLVAELGECEPSYIRCIKSNDRKKGGEFDKERVREQIQYLGVVENVRVRRAGYAYRSTFERFAARYKLLSASTWPKSLSDDARRDTEILLQEVGMDTRSKEVKFGKTKIFIKKAQALFTLEERRERRIVDLARAIQDAYRAYAARKYFLELREKARGIFAGRKRRRGSWALYFLGDYVGAKDSIQVAQVLKDHGEHRVLFADKVVKVNRKGVQQDRVLVITERAIHTLVPGKLASTNRVPLSEITGLQLSTYADGYFVVKVNSRLKSRPADFVFHSIRKAEIVTVLSEQCPDLQLDFDDVLTFRCKMGHFSTTTQVRSITFKEQPGNKGNKGLLVLGTPDWDVHVPSILGSKASLQLDHTAGTMLSHRVVGAMISHKKVDRPASRPMTSTGYSGGASAVRAMGVSQASHKHSANSKPPPVPPSRKKPPPPASKPRVKALYDFYPTESGQLGFKDGDVLTVLDTDDENWWNCAFRGKTGLVPANYVEKL